MTNGQSAGKSYAYLVGVYLGDGCVTEDQYNSIFRLNTIDRDFAETAKAALLNIGAKTVSLSTHSVKKSSNPNHSLAARGREFCARFVMDTDAKQKLPDGIMDWSLDHKLAFIAGLMDSEGFVAANSNSTNRRFYMGFKSCDGWVPGFIKVLESVGIRIGKVQIEAPRKPGYKAPTRFTIKMQSWIDSGARFNIARKQSRVDEWAVAGAYERRAKFPRRLSSETTRRTEAVDAAL